MSNIIQKKSSIYAENFLFAEGDKIMHNQFTLCYIFRHCLGILSKYFSFLEMNYVKDFLIMGLQVDINLISFQT